MDERHWWIATRVNESLKDSTKVNISDLESVFLESNNLTCISSFLEEDGPIYLYFAKQHNNDMKSIFVSSDIKEICDRSQFNTEMLKVILILKKGNSSISTNNFENELFCVEMKNPIIKNMSALFTHGLIPLIEGRYRSMEHPEKRQTLSSQLHSVWQSVESCTDQLFHHMTQEEPIKSFVDVTLEYPDPLKQYETFVTEVMNEIEGILSEVTDRSSEGDIFLSGEMEKWQKRFLLTQSLVNQLKGKMFKNSIGYLVSKKSKMIKRWRLLEISITEALNTSRDKMKYLEAFKVELGIMERYSSSPVYLLFVIPKIFKKMKKMESASRFFARSGHLGSFLSMLRRQILTILDNKMQSIIGYSQSSERIFDMIEKEISDEVVHRFIDMNEHQVKVLIPKEEIGSNIESFNTIMINGGVVVDSFLGICKLSNILFDLFNESLVNLREALNLNVTAKYASGQTNNSTDGTEKSEVEVEHDFISIYDDNKLLSSWIFMKQKLKSFIDVCWVLATFDKMMSSKALYVSLLRCDIQKQIEKAESSHLGTKYSNRMEGKYSDRDSGDSTDEGSEGIQAAGMFNLVSSLDHLRNLLTMNVGNEVEVNWKDVIRSTYSSVHENLKSKLDVFSLSNMSRSMSSDSMKVDDVFTRHEEIMSFFDKMFSVFINLVFLRPMRTDEILTILSKFDCLKFRKVIKGAIFDKVCEVFLNFNKDIADAYDRYKSFKKEPIVMQGTPPIVSAVAWAQKVLTSIESPMKRFRDMKEVTQMKEYEPTVRQYNKVSKQLMAFQSAYTDYWLSMVDSCVSKLKSPLLIVDFVNYRIEVNSPENVITVINETRHMIRLQRQISPAALELLKSERRIKYFYSKLTDSANYFEEVKEMIPLDLIFLFKNYIKSVMQSFQAGCTSLTWSTVNIDVFLHKVVSCVTNMKQVIEGILQLDMELNQSLKRIETNKMFDYELFLSHSWQPSQFAKVSNNQLVESKSRVEKIVEECVGFQSEIRKIIFPEEKRKSNPWLFDAEETIIMELKERYDIILGNSISRSIANNLLYIGICTNCKKESLATFISSSNYNPLKHISNQDESDHSDYHMFCISDMKQLLRDEDLGDDDRARLIKFIVVIKFEMPEIKYHPELEVIQLIIGQIGEEIIKYYEGTLTFSGTHTKRILTIDVGLLEQLASEITANFYGYQLLLQGTLDELRKYESRWKMSGEHLNIEESLGETEKYDELKKRIGEWLALKSNLQLLPKEIEIDCLVISTSIFKEVLLSLLNTWQNSDGQQLHEEAKRLLDQATNYREGVSEELKQDILELEQLNDLLGILDRIFDLDLKIDSIYQPIEQMYTDLKKYNLPILRSEDNELGNLRQYWSDLMKMAEGQRNRLLHEKKNVFHQELDKQMKKFTVEVIQFRNYFDYECPSMAGSDPIEVEKKLETFQKQYALYEEKRNTLVSISKLFGLTIQDFHELESMKEDLMLLTQLYSLYQKFSKFEKSFNGTLWSIVDLDDVFIKLTDFWDECLALPSKIKEKESYSELKGQIDYLIKVHSIMIYLNAKEIRNRHWLMVMQVTGANFQLESGTFKCSSLIGINLLEHKSEIEQICSDAKKEMQLEIKLHQIEEEWTEQVLVFQNHVRRGPVILEVKFTHGLLLQLEDSQIILMSMFNSRHIDPMKEEAALWAAKLMEISEVLDMWLEVQQLWLDLEDVFINPVIMKEFSQECKRFERLDKSYIKTMKRAFETKNVFQCCISNEHSKKSFLKNIQQGMENCFESLKTFLKQKRNLFSRLWFVPDATILSILNCSKNLTQLEGHMKLLFTAINELQTADDSNEERLQISSVLSAGKEELIFKDNVVVKDDVIGTLNAIKHEVTETLGTLTNEAINYLTSGDSLEEMARKFPTQICNSALHLFWTNEIFTAINDLKVEKKSLLYLTKKFNTQVSRIPITLNRNTWKSSGDQLITAQQRIRLRSMTLSALYLRDSLVYLSGKKIKDNDDFEWHKLIKMSVTKSVPVGPPKFQLSVVTGIHDLGSEFQGNLSTIAWSPVTERCLLTLMTTFEHQQIGSLSSPSQFGKSTLIGDIARMTNQFNFTMICQSSMSPECLRNFLSGLATNECMGVLDNVEQLGNRNISLVMVIIAQVRDALRLKNETVSFFEGDQINLRNGFNICITSSLPVVNLEAKIPSNIRSAFRIICLTEPDILQVLKWYCTFYNFRAGRILALRLHTLMKQASSLIGKNGKEILHVRSIVEALKKTSKLKRLLIQKERSDTSETGQDNAKVSGSSFIEFWPSFIERKPKSPILTMIKQKTMDVPVPLSPAAKQEHQMVAEALLETILPSIHSEYEKAFKEIMKDTFPGYSEIQPKTSKDSIPHELLVAIGRECKLQKISASNTFIEKFVQIYNVAKCHQSVVLCGPTFSGKSTALKILLSSMNHVCETHTTTPDAPVKSSKHISPNLKDYSDTPLLNMNHHLYTIFPSIFENENEMFGIWSANKGTLNDGLLTYLWRRANRNDLVSWIAFDGIIKAEWSLNLHPILDSSHSLYLPDGHCLPQMRDIKLIFEMESLNDASPGIVARSGVIYFAANTLTWRDVKNMWLDGKRSLDVIALTKIFDKIMDPVSVYVAQYHKEYSPNVITIVFQNSLKILSQMLVENKEIGGERHIQRLFTFCFIWCLDCQIQDLNKSSITALLKKETIVLPDDENSICIFDYYVDESGEWDLWSSRLGESIDTSSFASTGQVVVDSIASIRCKYLMEIATRAALNFAIVGPRGSGKSLLLDNHWRKKDLSATNIARLVYSRFTKSSQLKMFLEANIEHRHGLMYGGKENKHLILLIEDLSRPIDHHKDSNIVGPNEILRQLLNSNMIQNTKHPYEQIKISDFNVIVTISTEEFSGVDSLRALNPRLMRNFVPIKLEMHLPTELGTIIRGIFECNLASLDNNQITIDQTTCLVNSTHKLYQRVLAVLQQSPSNGRRYIAFTLRNINDIAVSLRLYNFETPITEPTLLQYWIYLARRIFQDRLSLEMDTKWFDTTVESIVKEVWTTDQAMEDIDFNRTFSTFPVNSENKNNDTKVNPSIEGPSTANPVDDFIEAKDFVMTKINQHNEEFGREAIEMIISDNVLLQIINIHRLITKPYNGHVVIIGSIGTHLSQVCRVALQIAEIPNLPLDTSSDATFIDSMKSVLRMVGSEGKKAAILLTARDLRSTFVIDSLNSLMISGDCPLLFPADELAGLLSAISISLKKDKTSTQLSSNYSLMEQFRCRIRANLHIILCLPRNHNIVAESLEMYPGLLLYSGIMWLKDSSVDYLEKDSGYFVENCLNEINLYLSDDSDRENLIQFIVAVHQDALRSSENSSSSIGKMVKIGKIGNSDKKKEIYKYDNVTSAPYSQIFLRDAIVNLTDNKCKSRIHVGPSTFHRFLHIFQGLLSQKSVEKTQSIHTLTRALNCLKQTKHDINTITNLISKEKDKFNDISEKSKKILKELIDKVTLLRMMTAKKGDNSYLNDMLSRSHVATFSVLELDPLLIIEERDELDIEFEKVREESLKNRQSVLKETLNKMKKEYLNLKKDLAYAIEQVTYWKGKIDRQVIDRIKSFINPPTLVVDVIEMIFVLIGKHLQRSRRDSELEENDSDDERSESKVRWKRMQQFMSDPAKFVDIIHNVPWTDGLNQDVYIGVKGYLATGKEGQTGVTGEGTMLNQAENVKAKKSRPESLDNVESDIVQVRAISVAATKYASEDAALLVQYTVALVEYTEKCGPIRQIQQKIRELEIELQESQDSSKKVPEEPSTSNYDYDSLDLSEEEIEKLKVECFQLETSYNDLIGQRSIVETELNALSERLEMSQWLVDNIKSMETKWENLSAKYHNDRLIFVQCLISSAYLAYGGPLCYEHRIQFLNNCVQLAKKTTFVNDNFTFSRLQITQFLHNEIELQKLELFGLPVCEDELDNATFILNEWLIRNWLLLSDKTRRVISWLGRCLVKYDVIVIPYSEVHNRLEGCLASGNTLIVTDCDVNLLANDDIMRQILRNQHKFFKEEKPFKLMLGKSYELECSPSFRLFLHTCSLPSEIPAIVVSSTFLVSFNASMPILISEFSNRFIQKAKPSIDSERTIILKEKGKMKKKLFKIEEQMLDDLSNGIRNVNSIENCRRIIRYLKLYEEIDANLQQKQFSYSSNKKSVENYDQIAVRFSICFQMTTQMNRIQPDYSFDFDKYINLFDSLVESSERLSNKSIIEKITKKTSQYSLLSMNDENKFPYCLLLSIEIHKALNHLEPQYEEFFLSPLNLAQKINPDIVKIGETKASNNKKPFDWMTEEQMVNTRIISTCFPAFKDIFEGMSKDVREHQWRILFEGESPETVNFLDKLFKSQLNPFQRLCLIRTIRPDRIMQASYLFIQQTLNLKLNGGMSVSDIKLALQSTRPLSAILLKYNYDSKEPSLLLQQLQTKCQAFVIEISINDQSKGGLKTFQHQLTTMISRTCDLMLSESSMSTATPNLTTFIIIHLSSCENILVIQTRVSQSIHQILISNADLFVSKSRDHNNLVFNIFFTISNSVLKESNILSQLNMMTPVLLDSPNNVREFFVQMFTSGWIVLEKKSAELMPVLHNCALLMSIIRSRCNYSAVKFQDSQTIKAISNPGSLCDLVEKFQKWFQKNPVIFWSVLRYFVSEVIYGGCISNDFDRLAITSMTDFWLTANSVRKEFEFPKLKHHCPAILYSPNPKLEDVKRALVAISPFLFECAEACHLTTTSLTKVNSEKLLITKVSRMTLEISGRSTTPLSIDITKVESELFEMMKNLAAKLPKSTLEVVQEKLKRVNNGANYVHIILNEIREYQSLFAEVAAFIQRLRKVISNDLGDKLTEEDIEIILSLLYNNVPEKWQNKLLVRQSYANTSPVEWLGILLTKYQHMERLIVTVKDKVAYYWLSAFQIPQSLMALFNEDVLSQFMKSDRSGSYREVKYNVEFTNRDKDHIRDPPADGIFVHGLYLWGCGFDKTSCELLDTGTKSVCTALPVAHITFISSDQEKLDNSDQYICPVFLNSASRNLPIMNVTIFKEGVSPTKWMLRGVFITTNPF